MNTQKGECNVYLDSCHQSLDIFSDIELTYHMDSRTCTSVERKLHVSSFGINLYLEYLTKK